MFTADKCWRLPLLHKRVSDNLGVSRAGSGILACSSALGTFFTTREMEKEDPGLVKHCLSITVVKSYTVRDVNVSKNSEREVQKRNCKSFPKFCVA